MTGDRRIILEVEKTPVIEVPIPPTKEELTKKLQEIGDKVLVIDQVSKRFYPKEEDFIIDAKKVGFVSRAVPSKPGIFKILHKGKRVFTTRFVRDKKGDHHWIFGYYEITGLATNLPDELMEEAKKKFNNFTEEYEAGKQVVRGCGDYMVVSVIKVRDLELHEIAEALYGIAKEHNFKIKFLVVGKFHKLPVRASLRGVPSVRNITRIPLEEKTLIDAIKQGIRESVQEPEVEVLQISNYNLGKRDVKQKLITEFILR